MTPGARRKFGAPIFATEVFRKQMYCMKMYLWHCWEFSAPPQSFGPRNDSAPP